ncbi:facilitated trehalose transporter Tret1-2 homolog [Tribolium castaneum]|uniref:Facilitated trehalose transporter Tret1-2 homolog-like Protein n=1 Tax=Tribolium castaneum TaxID=7070 RepID=D6X031_TRICA|nr:PREDICTED: facilitated trehalose transporter Tret1-2 homolog [Tribolium castaneum]EFA10056.1 Facilitated trehalose transporter Tret1-2 homolog-like Protein [Tribolium castaneum]|eukprot:XP_015838547.1 PREDICTED: facilitated trehalose transporter Tret1-2 homolog [Tribolium castaneum]
MYKFCTYTFLTVLTVDILAICGDITMTWTSPILPKLYSNDSNINPLDRPITPDEESWIGSLINIGAVIGPFPFSFLSEKLGRKISLLCISVPYIISNGILALVPHIYWYYFARFLAGIALGGANTVLSVYISEIAEDSNRGMLSVTLNVFWTFGNLIPYVLGPYMSILAFNLTLACVPLLFFVLFATVAPETPYYLINKNMINKAEESLMKLRGRSRSMVSKEIIHIQSSMNQEKKGSFGDLFKTKANRKALAISVTLMTFQQLSGISAILFYTQLIFETTGSNISAEISALIIGLVLFSTSFIIPFVADRLGRKLFLMISAFGMMVALAILGTFFYMKDTVHYDVTSFSWLPILSLVLYIVSINLGFIPLPWTVSSELFSPNVKSFGISLVSFTCRFSSFIVTKFFNDLNNVFGKEGTFWLFSGFCLLAGLFTLFFVPETRGKSFQEIQIILEK